MWAAIGKHFGRKCAQNIGQNMAVNVVKIQTFW
jgi:hypothetical protein